MKGSRVRLAASLAVMITAFAGSAVAKEWTHLTIGVEGAFPPFNMLSSDGKLSGYDIDVANEVCKRANLKCDLVAQDWDSQIPSLTAGKFDAVLTMGPNAKRREVIDFTIPYAQTSNSFAVLKSSPLAKMPYTGKAVSVNDAAVAKPILDALRTELKGKVVGAPLSTSQQQFVEETFKGDVEVRTYKSSEQNDLDLVDGRIDAEFNNIVYLNSVVGKPGNEDMVIVGPKFTGGVMATDVCFGTRKNSPDLKAILDKAIQSAVADGTLHNLSLKWFKIDVSPK